MHDQRPKMISTGTFQTNIKFLHFSKNSCHLQVRRHFQTRRSKWTFNWTVLETTVLDRSFFDLTHGLISDIKYVANIVLEMSRVFM